MRSIIRGDLWSGVDCEDVTCMDGSKMEWWMNADDWGRCIMDGGIGQDKSIQWRFLRR